jgi:hypothetical protein
MLYLKTLLVGLCLTASLAAAQADEDSLHYEVQRNGKTIGTHEVEFERHGGRLTVEIETDVAVKIAFLTVYRFKHEAREEWQNGKLIAYQSTSDDNGTDKFLNVGFANSAYSVEASSGRFKAQSLALPASLWRPDTVTQSRLMNTLDGHEMKVAVKDIGLDTITVGGKEITATHFSMTGDLQRELWYAHDRLVHLRFLGDDGSTIDYNLR